MARKSDPKTALKELYQSYDRGDLATHGRTYLKQDLRISAPRVVRWSWLLTWGFLALLAWGAAVAVITLLETTRTTADHVEQDRTSQLKAQEVPSE